MNQVCSLDDELQESEVDPNELGGRQPDGDGHLQALNRMRALEGYYQWTFKLMRGYISGDVLDAGCGVGSFTALAEPVASSVFAVDVDPAHVAQARRRFLNSPKVKVVEQDLTGLRSMFSPGSFDTITCLDVLEHIQDDFQMLSIFRGLLKAGGHLGLKVPACPWLFGPIDSASGHFRRYSLRSLREKAVRAGLEPLSLRYMNALGVLPYWVKCRLLRERRNFSRTFSPWQLSLIRRVVPVLALVDRKMPPPVGQSLVMVARRGE